jgi:hypothetical protein
LELPSISMNNFWSFENVLFQLFFIKVKLKFSLMLISEASSSNSKLCCALEQSRSENSLTKLFQQIFNYQILR